jgi:AcrR family transcriptional regulator
MTDTEGRTMARGELILLTAIDALGRYGVKGASLRDIARGRLSSETSLGTAL